MCRNVEVWRVVSVFSVNEDQGLTLTWGGQDRRPEKEILTL